MAHNVEPMDIDSDFDNKENSLHHNNVLPFTEKGYEELDVSELNMKLRYSITPASSPMSKSFSAICPENRTAESGDESLHVTVNENLNLTRSLNSTITKNDCSLKSLKSLPLQSIPPEQYGDCNRNTTVLRPLETAILANNGNLTVTVSAHSDIDENLSLPSSSSSALHTPEATTPTKDLPLKDGGSPIMRGLKSVLNMFRSSQSPIPPADNELLKSELLSPEEELVTAPGNKTVLASTPISSYRKKEMSPTKRSSPPKETTIVFNDDLEKELQWKDETTIIFSQERIPIHKLLLQPNDFLCKDIVSLPKQDAHDLNSTVEYMDISYNDSFRDRTLTDVNVENVKSEISVVGDSDSEFVDCETTFTKNISENVADDNDKTAIADQTPDLDTIKAVYKNESGSRLKQIILDTTQDILDATLSIRPEDLLPESLDQNKNMSAFVVNKPQTLDTLNKTAESKQIFEEIITSDIDQQVTNLTVDIRVPMTLETHTSDPNGTTTIEVTSTNTPVNHMFHTTSSNSNEEQSKQSSDAMVPIDAIVGITETVCNEPRVPENLNIAESPANIPLPDENEFVKEFDQPVDAVTESTSHGCGSDSDHFIKDVILETNQEMDATEEMKLDLIVNRTNFDNSVNNVICLDKDTEAVYEIRDNAPTNIETKNLNEKVNDLLNPEVLLQTNNNKKEIAEDITTKNQEINTTEGIKNVDTNETLENIEKHNNVLILNATENEHVMGLDVNESNREYECLPDIINETITMTKTDSLEVTVNTTGCVVIEEKQSESEKHDKPVRRHSQEIKEVMYENETVINNSDNQEHVIETKCGNDQILAPISTTDGIMIEGLTVGISHPLPLEAHNNVTSSNTSVNRTFDDATSTISNEEYLKNTNNLTTLINTSMTDNNNGIIESETKFTEPIEFNVESGTVANNQHPDLELPHLGSENSNVALIKEKSEEEFIISENNSPFVSVIAESTPEDNIQCNTEIDSFINTNKTITESIVTQPSSPPITSKGYNFNFDDMNFDPFATKTKIRVSPPLDTTTELISDIQLPKTVDKPVLKKELGRRRSQTERKKPTPKKKLNSTFDGKLNDKVIEKPVEKIKTEVVGEIIPGPPATIAMSLKDTKIDENNVEETMDFLPETVNLSKNILNSESDVLEDHIQKKKIEVEKSEIMAENDANIESSLHVLKDISSSEQSTYLSACGSSSEGNIVPRNVFNLPEIDDINFNPFATISKMRQSPSPSLDMKDPFATKNKIRSSPDCSVVLPEPDQTKTFEHKIETELMEKDTSLNASEATVSSKASDERNVTTKEINTEDEDTVEGPFIEADLEPNDKLPDFDCENDMMQFNEIPTQTNDENLDGELFIDAEAFEFLLNQNKCNTVVDSGKESLFLKFDPLFAKRMSAITSDGLVASLAKVHKKQSTPTKAAHSPSKSISSPVPGTSTLNVTQDMETNTSDDFCDDLNITVSKPMMVVPPAVNPVTHRNKSVTPNRSNRSSFTFTSPAMAVIDRLLSLSANNSLVHETNITQTSREHIEADIALSQLREALAEKEIYVYKLRSESNELKDRLSSLESQLKNIEIESHDRLAKINQLNGTLVEKTKINKSMAAVVEEYERTIASLIAETAQDKKRHDEERIKLINERDEQTAHLASMEVSFSDLHSKYEKSKQVIANCKANEDVYKKSIKQFEESLTKMQNNYELLKQHATSKLNTANLELEKMNRSHEAEVLKLNAMIKRKELHITSLEESLAQKTKANEELTAICDELINKVG